MLETPQTKWTKGQWPDNLCSGFITFTPSKPPLEILVGSSCVTPSHGIPVFGSVLAETFNYPGQTEDVTRRLVACWNAMVGRPIEEIEAIAAENARS